MKEIHVTTITETVAAMEGEDVPAIVVIDSLGDNYYETGQAPYRQL